MALASEYTVLGDPNSSSVANTPDLLSLIRTGAIGFVASPGLDRTWSRTLPARFDKRLFSRGGSP